MDIETLLRKISTISEKYDLIYKKTGEYFNIFEIANIATAEVTICRVIHELLDPKGSHFQGDIYLRLFNKHVLGSIINDDEYNSVSVYREYRIDNDRRIDLVIETNDKFIPIEVKIYAADQGSQCYDYYGVAKNSKIYYLTLDGHLPSKSSTGDLNQIKDKKGCITGYKELVLLSFADEILLWLKMCLTQQETIRIAPIREVIQQLAAVIEKITNTIKEEQEMEIVKIISASQENMRAAVTVEKSLIECKRIMLKEVLTALNKKIDEENIFEVKRREMHHDYEFDNEKLISKYYRHIGSSWPGFSYRCRNLPDLKVDIDFRVEIDWRIIAGFCVSEDGVCRGKLLNSQRLGCLFKKSQENGNSWWIYWEYLPYSDENSSPNFKDHNDAFYDLFDKDKFEKFVEDSVNKIRIIYSNLIT